MATGAVDLRGAEATLLITLYLRERDAASAHPILGDPYAGPALARVRYDPGAVRWFSSDTATITARAKQLDGWARAFLAEHPDGQVLHLGCGLDSRPLRLERPAGSRWLDVDTPRVAELRRRVYDLPDDVELVASSVTEPDWWDRVDRDRPTLALAEGLFMYLAPDDVHGVVDRLLEHCARGRLAFDGVADWVRPASNATLALFGMDARFRWGYAGAAFRDRHPRLEERDDVAVTELAAAATRGPWHAVYRGVDLVPYLRDTMRLHRYAF
ncbi:O-methyltransferase [Actinomycetospora succinea]|uniref:O-methyltransferase n=1 Tax=Actinomycetospora succinea TaxID=663603 RepID=A0A4V3D7R9_9PSEU|nr:class I SAM-dependent methyltransferase [Actinomycetospora succinea]TDQ48947.1 O-methyltransferase [Actinomycetospora succinea]